MKYLARFSLALGLLAAAAFTFAAQSWTDKYDTKKTVTLTGTVNRLWFAPDIPFCIVLETTESDSKTQQWVVEGNSASELRAAGWVFGPPPSGTLNLNEKISVTAYLPKKGSKGAEELAAASPQLADVLKSARLVHGIQVTLPNGKKLPFGAAQ